MEKDVETTLINQRASLYLARYPAESADQRRQREAWLAEDPRHRRAYEQAQGLWEQAGALRDDPEMMALYAEDLAALNRRRWPRFSRLLPLAATLALLAGGLYVGLRIGTAPAPMRYATELGEQRTERLPDGTVAVLDTDTALEARYTRRRREVELERGQVQFEVAHDAGRPFVVVVGEGSVRALGTRFQVRREAERDTITLLQGQVEVARGQVRRVLQPNEQAHLSAAGIEVAAVDPQQAQGWLDGWLRFRDVPLGQIVAEANRYSARKLRLGSAELAGLPMTGNFHAGDSAAVAAAAEAILPVRVEASGDEIVLQPR